MKQIYKTTSIISLATVLFVAAMAVNAATGEEVYKTTCATCHATGVLNAPKLGDATAWEKRVTERGMDGLYASALNGFNNNAMPPKGLCMKCSDEELKAAVDYMIKGAE